MMKRLVNLFLASTVVAAFLAAEATACRRDHRRCRRVVVCSPVVACASLAQPSCCGAADDGSIEDIAQQDGTAISEDTAPPANAGSSDDAAPPANSGSGDDESPQAKTRSDENTAPGADTLNTEEIAPPANAQPGNDTAPPALSSAAGGNLPQTLPGGCCASLIQAVVHFAREHGPTIVKWINDQSEEAVEAQDATAMEESIQTTDSGPFDEEGVSTERDLSHR